MATPKIKIPKARQLASGSWNIYLDKEKISVTAATERDCEREAMGIRMGFITKEGKTFTANDTLSYVLTSYINSRDSVLSHSTLNGYKVIARTRFQRYMDKSVDSIDWQTMVNEEAKVVSAKTVQNSWLFVVSALKAKGIVAKVRLPKIKNLDLPFLDSEQIPLFLDAIKGYSCEIGALLMINGLRRSEALAVTKGKIKDGYIIVDSALVRDEFGSYTLQKINKTRSSTRKVPILIPRLEQLVTESSCKDTEPIVDMTPNRLYDRINEACDRAGVPRVGCHGLRRTFASFCAINSIPIELCAEWGGWDDYQTMSQIYTKYSAKDRSRYVSELQSKICTKSVQGQENQ